MGFKTDVDKASLLGDNDSRKKSKENTRKKDACDYNFQLLNTHFAYKFIASDLKYNPWARFLIVFDWCFAISIERNKRPKNAINFWAQVYT